MINLLSNSTKYTPGGYVNVKVEWLPGKTKITDDIFSPVPYDSEDEGVYFKDENFDYLNSDMMTYFPNGRFLEPWRTYPKKSTEKGILKLTVCDSGIGISPEDIKNLFKQFYQTEQNAATKHKGTGLGLYITKLICEKMGGKIEVFSKENSGSTFVICLKAESLPEPVDWFLDPPNEEFQFRNPDLVSMYSQQDNPTKYLNRVPSDDNLKRIP